MTASLTVEFVLFAVRLVLGAVMVYYGWPKIRDLRAAAREFDIEKGIRPGWLFGTIVALTEFGGGLLLLLGIIPEFAAAAFAFQMTLGTFWKIKAGKGFPAWSYDLLALVTALTVMVLGGGLWSGTYAADWFLRTDVVVLALVLALAGALMSKPKRK